MHFETMKRDEILPTLEQAKDQKEQKKILCDLLECSKEELEALIKELKAERAAKEKEVTKKVAENDELAEIAAYAKKLEGDLKKKDEELEELKEQYKREANIFVERANQFDEELEDARTIAEEKNKEIADLKSARKDIPSAMMRNERNADKLSLALAKSLEFIASLNGVISELLRS